ncbi:MAG: roadblock/LC7 domain-containing protein [Gemmatimonadota bacterium]
MSQLQSTLERLGEHEGVEHVVLLGGDGLVIQHVGLGVTEAETVAARIPGLASASQALGTATGQGDFVTAALEHESGVTIVVALSGDLLLAIVIRAGVGFAPLLRDLRSQRARLIDLL